MKRILFVWLLVVLPLRARAALGELESSFDKDGQKLKAESLKPMQMAGVARVREMTVQGTSVKEYISASGAVFALTWSGMGHPDLSVLLGSHYAEFKALSAKHKGRGPSRVQTSQAIVMRGGHMRSLHGRAYISSLIPEGFKMEDLK